MTDPTDPPQKPKQDLVQSSSPMFESIMAPRAAMLVKQLCRVKRMPGQTKDWIDVVKETAWNKGIDNENLEQRSLNIGTVGMVVGIAQSKTTLRFMVATGNEHDDGIYHVNVINLEPIDQEG